MDKIIWVVGQYKGGKFPNTNWDLYGVFTTKEKAIAVCNDKSYFIGPVEINKTLGEESVMWPGCLYPKA